MIKIIFDKKEIIINEILFLLLSQFTFSFIIFIWFILYKWFGLFKYANPLFALLITFIQNIIVLTILAKKRKINKNNIIRYIYILLIIKIIPLLTYFPNYLSFTLKDIFITIYLYLIYIILIIAIIEIFNIKFDIKQLINDDLFGENYNKSPQTIIYDMTYNELISKII